MRGRRIVLTLVIAVLPLAGAAGRAGAAPPRAGCPPAFLGPWSFETIVDEFPPPPGVPIEDAFAALAFYDKNGDRQLCVQDNPAPGINVVDNASNVP